MCGIAGIWQGPTDGAAGARVAAMLAAMRHRGPDGEGRLAFAGGAAGMVRLALVDLSPRGDQPMWSPDGRVAVLFNGEVYDFRRERARLATGGYRFASTTDTEVVLALYLERGLDFVERLRGMYAVALLDWRGREPGSTPRLVLARDPFGIKPLYVAGLGAGGGLVFASELRGLLASGLVPRQVDPRGLADYLAHGFVPQPATILAGVRALEAGTLEVHEPGEPARRRRFWTFPPAAPRVEGLDEAAARLRGVLEESVELHAFADAPVGAFLSGGADSAAVVALMRRHVADLRTFTLRLLPATGTGGDESEEAAAVAARLGCRHTTVEVGGGEVAVLLPRFAGDLDQPSIDGLNTWLISRIAGREVRGVLSGLGGDEWFAGYPVARRMARLAAGGVRSALARLGAGVARRVEELPADPGLRARLHSLAARRSPLAAWMSSHGVFPRREADRLAGIDPPGDEEAAWRALLDDVRPDWREESPVGLATLLDARLYMGSQLLRDSDAAGMAHSLELRVPLVDLEVAAFSRTCADDLKLTPAGDGTSYRTSGAKRVLLAAVADLLPPGLADRPKRGFALPYAGWMRTAAADLVDETCRPETVAARGLLDPDGVAPLHDRRERGPGYLLYPRLWALMTLELWCREVLDPALPEPLPVEPPSALAAGAS